MIVEIRIYYERSGAFITWRFHLSIDLQFVCELAPTQRNVLLCSFRPRFYSRGRRVSQLRSRYEPGLRSPSRSSPAPLARSLTRSLDPVAARFDYVTASQKRAIFSHLHKCAERVFVRSLQRIIFLSMSKRPMTRGLLHDLFRFPRPPLLPKNEDGTYEAK